ncbi:MAG: MoaD/ThiS family protein [Candidatus Odinarchaeia archaeon]
MVKVKFFAMFRELAGTPLIEVDIKEEVNIYGLLEKIYPKNNEKYEKFINSLKSPRIKIIINKKALKKSDFEKVKIRNSDEVVFLPPVGGG